MKTTAGKSKTKRPTRVVQIFYLGKPPKKKQPADADRVGKLLAVRPAESLKIALNEYYDDVLQHQGYTKPLVNGNVMTVKDKFGLHQYVAREA